MCSMNVMYKNAVYNCIRVFEKELLSSKITLEKIPLVLHIPCMHFNKFLENEIIKGKIPFNDISNNIQKRCHTIFHMI